MPYRKGKDVLPGDPDFGTRWATAEEKTVAARALYSLETERNRIVLVPAPRQSFDGHKIRVQESRNPDWFREFVDGRWDRRGCQVKRSRVIGALKRVCVTGIVRRNGYEVAILEKLLERNIWAK